MKSVLLVMRSVTHAQRAKRTLGKKRISAQIVRPDTELTGGCGYALKVAEIDLPESVSLLRDNSLPPVMVAVLDDNGYRELSI